MYTKKQLSKKIQSISTTREQLNENIHVVLCNIAGHTLQYGDFTLVKPLLDAIKGSDLKAVIKYARENCFVNISEKGEVSISKARREKEQRNPMVLVEDLLNGTKWYEQAETVKKAVKALDVASRINSLAKAIEKSSEVSIDQQQIEIALRSLQNSLENKRANYLT